MLYCHYAILLLIRTNLVYYPKGGEMNKMNEMNEISTENLNKPIPKTVGTTVIRNKTIHVNGRSTFMGDPSDYAKQEDLIDGKERKFTISTVEKFDAKYKEEKIQPINNFYVTKIIYEQIGRLDKNIDELFEKGSKTGGLVVCKVKGPKRPYWSILTEADFSTSDKVVKEG